MLRAEISVRLFKLNLYLDFHIHPQQFMFNICAILSRGIDLVILGGAE